MTASIVVSFFRKLRMLADWRLLLFLVLFLNVKMAIKVPVIALIYLLQFNFKFGFSLKNSRLPLFYLLAIAIALLNWVISLTYFNINYDIVLITGIGFWALCILAMHQVKLFVEQNDTETIHRTIIIFFIINAVLSLLNIASIIWETGYFNPYTYQGQFQKYFISTGDYIRGLTFDTSTTNAILNAFGCIYFLTKKNTGMLLLCMAIMLLTASNFTNIILLFCFAILFIFKSTRDQKSLIAICIMFLVTFMVKVSPQNYIYAHEVVKNTFHLSVIPKAPIPAKPNLPITLMPDSLLNADQIRQKIAQHYIDSNYAAQHQPVQKPTVVSKAVRSAKVVQPAPTKTEAGRIILPKPDINTRPYQHIADTNDYQRQLLAFIGTHKADLPISSQENYKPNLPGKATSTLQTLHFLLNHPVKLMMGDGIGNFSSKLAFRVSGLGFAGGYPHKYVYLDPDFLSNHLDVYLNYFSKNTSQHSLSNSPDSVYDQLLAEYGLLGLIAFFIWYIWYFLKHYKILTYGLPILLIVMAVMFIAYWFEQLSILVFFELLLLLDIKENSPKTQIINAY
ncbi:MAG: hypothetical protein JST50_04425 [Bacteroidetes bacterium]|jgi:hypothetical protein|nr:hypothetical protein [Bacteroidota bacterium]